MAVWLTLSFIVVGCSPDGSPQTSSDCSAQVRVDGIAYTSHGYTDREASRHSVAEAAECHDVGEDAGGSVFPEQPRQVTTWSFRGYPPEEVLGVRFDKDSFAVFVADSVPLSERERIWRELAKSSPLSPRSHRQDRSLPGYPIPLDADTKPAHDARHGHARG